MGLVYGWITQSKPGREERLLREERRNSYYALPPEIWALPCLAAGFLCVILERGSQHTVISLSCLA